jgi:tetratricopeptide (TPR) repeat protein
MGFCLRDIGLAGVLSLFLGSTATTAAPNPLDSAEAALQSGNAAGAIAQIDQVLSEPGLQPGDRARALADRGLAHEMLGEHAGALDDFTAAIAAHGLADPEQARAYFDRGVTLDELGRTAEALDSYSAALNLVPRYAAAFNNRGNAYRRLGRLDEARADYQASLAAGNPHTEYPDYGLGQIAEAQGQLDVARSHYRSALGADPQFSLAADRLTALGEGAGDAEPVVLRPPSQTPAASEDAPPRSAKAHPTPVRVASVAPYLKPALSDGADSAPGEMIQLGAWRHEVDAANAWNSAQTAAGDLLANLSPQVLAVDVAGKGRLYRLRTGPVLAGGASRLCDALRAKGQACIVVRN